MNLSNLSIKAKLFATLGLLAGLLCVVGTIGFMGMRQTNAQLDAMFNGRLVPANWTDQLTTMQRKGIEAIELATIKQDAASVAAAVEAVKGNADKIKEMWSKLDKTEVSEAESKLIASFGVNNS